MKNFKKTCPCCEHTVRPYKHKLNKGLVNSLKQLVDFYQRTKKRANLDKDLNLTYNQQSNFQKLKYFDFIERTSDGWLPTRRGIEFIMTDLSILDGVITLGKEILPIYHPIREEIKKPKLVTYKSVMEVEYKKRKEYATEFDN